MLQSTHGLGVAPRQVRVEERLQDAGIELALEVEDVERDAELAGDATRVVGGVERAAALLELAVRVGDVVQAHPDADDLDALLVQERRRDRRIDAARHGDEDPLGSRRRRRWTDAGRAATAVVARLRMRSAR